MMEDEYFFEFVVGPPVEYLVMKIEEELEARKSERVEMPPKPKGRTMWDLPDPRQKG